MKVSGSGRKSHPLATRIKRLMQKDDEVGRIASVTPVLISRALELFLQKLCTNLTDYAQSRSAKGISPAHLKAYIASDGIMDFLKDIVKDAPDVKEGESSPLAAKRPRSVVEMSGVHRGSRRGKGGNSKRLCTPKRGGGGGGVNSESPSARSSVFASYTQGGPKNAGKMRTALHSSVSEPKPISCSAAERGGRVASLPAMTSAFRSMESVANVVDPSTLPIDIQKALHIIPATDTDALETTQNEMKDPFHRHEIRNKLSITRKQSNEETAVLRTPELAVQFGDHPGCRTGEGGGDLKAEEDDYDLEDEQET
eukprot:g2614.t1